MANFNDPHRPFHGSESEKNWSKYDEERFSRPSRVYGADEIVVPGFLPDLPDVRMEMAQYYSSVRRADDGVGAILKALDESGQSENTVVVFLSDHGISNPFAKLNCYQASLRVPLIVRYPRHIKAGQRDKFNMVSAVDLAPTLLELADLGVPESMSGRSFAPLLEGRPQNGRDHVIGYYYRNLRQTKMYPEFAVHMRDWVYIYNPWVDGVTEVHNSDYTGSPTLLAMWEAAETVPSIKDRADFHKYRIREELYNVRQDPHAYINVAGEAENRDRLAAMRGLLVDWMEDTDHPAAELMEDPHNEKRIAEYMEWERENAVKQIDELKRRKR
jgi:N-sulfoglucosamine sulfohydrolase